MKTLISALTAASLLLAAVPALADRDDRHNSDDHSRRFAQQHRERDQQHTNVRDTESRRAAREERREEPRQERREERRQAERRDDRREQHRGKDDHKFVKYVGYDPRYDRNRHDDGRGHNDRGPDRGYDRWHGYNHHPRPVQLAHKHRFRPSHFGYGHHWQRLPKTYVSLSFGGLGYYFSDGIFYRPYGAGYVVTQAPVGAFVQLLPVTATSVSYNGFNYFVAYDTYYRWDNHRHGYLVVSNPGFY